MALLERDVQLFVSSQNTGFTDTRKILPLSGYTLNQDVNLTKVQRTGLSGTFSRGYRSVFVNNVIRASAGITHYLNPFATGDCSEKPLWTGLLGNDSGISTAGNTLTMTTEFSNLKSLQEGTVWLKYPLNTFRMNNTVVEGVDIEFGTDSFPRASWTITGTDYSNVGDVTPTHTDATNRTCVLGKLTTVALTINSTLYTLGIVEGNLRISNGIRYTGRKRVGKVTTYPGHYTGVRDIEGEIKIYLHANALSLVQFLNSVKDNLENWPASLTIQLGGPTAPNIVFSLPRVILNMPDTSYDRILAASLRFTALETGVGNADELTITYNT